MERNIVQGSGVFKIKRVGKRMDKKQARSSAWRDWRNVATHIDVFRQ